MGELWNGKRHGKGVYYYENATYDGEWDNDIINGVGTAYYGNGNRYEGEWRNNKPHGKGKRFIKD